MTTGSKRETALSLLLEQPGVAVEDIKFFKGDASTFTSEEFWGEVHSALLQERAGTAEVTATPPGGAKLVDVAAVLNSL